MDVNHKSYPAVRALRDKDEVKILFVCLGNICRSPAAEGILRDIAASQDPDPSRYTIDSAGTGNYHVGDLPDLRMRIHARSRGINLDHRCRQVHESDFRDFDLIVPMDASNERNLHSLCPDPELEDKIVPMSAFFGPAAGYTYVPDPYYEGDSGFELVLDLLADGCCNLYDSIKKS
ncbi:MAG: low molecular weight phosphotyrosine protein phosphatase [Duncaniella sp.]|nr:low molecular weight phosphotyrosine protein phosphatase [Duncaniella sp.]